MDMLTHLDAACCEQQEWDSHQGKYHSDEQHARHRQVQAVSGLLCPSERRLLPCMSGATRQQFHSSTQSDSCSNVLSMGTADSFRTNEWGAPDADLFQGPCTQCNRSLWQAMQTDILPDARVHHTLKEDMASS